MGHLQKHNSFWEQSQKILNDENGYFGSYVHSCYYSIIQIILAKLTLSTYSDSRAVSNDYYQNKTSNKQRYRGEYNQNEGFGFHIFLEVKLNDVYYNLDIINKMKIRESFKICRKSRNKADYHKNEISDDDKELIIESFQKLKDILD